jgi:hypothetical protein
MIKIFVLGIGLNSAWPSMSVKLSPSGCPDGNVICNVFDKYKFKLLR